ncbi:hypothetical protein BBF96_02385 [Anoxybacter fermentans]|uniref:4Fe4S-binding SPASM domain-containing protein n=1 Tax=Anoxybacter fermentans TaxID=1323375 RepID=A0A3S9SVN5_9FIRM|nr:SPASM domain-containing protein [Anoxybacter fermentans]AZR72338.1 hypothetical protein BBF96_02385 [Anoxybacter fermentans]
MKATEVLYKYNVVKGTSCQRLQNFVLGKFRLRDCKSSGIQLVVVPDGMLGPCHSLVGFLEYYQGNIADPNCDLTQFDNFREWAKRYPLNMTLYTKCPFISLCGGCIYNSYITSNSIWNEDPQICTYMCSLVKWILHDLWKKRGMSEKYGSIE